MQFHTPKVKSENRIFLETDRLILRSFCENDLYDLYEYLSDDIVVRCEPYKAMDLMAVQQELDLRISSNEMIAVVLKAEDKLIGNVYLGKRDFQSLELGYVFNRCYWKLGYAKESCTTLIKKALSNGIHRILPNVTLVIQHPGDYWKAQAS